MEWRMKDIGNIIGVFVVMETRSQGSVKGNTLLMTETQKTFVSLGGE